MTDWLFVNMLFTKADKILIKNLFALKSYNAKHLVRGFPALVNELMLYKNG